MNYLKISYFKTRTVVIVATSIKVDVNKCAIVIWQNQVKEREKYLQSNYFNKISNAQHGQSFRGAILLCEEDYT